MSTFAVTSPGQVLDSVNYLLSNLNTGNATGNITVPDGTLVANVTTGAITPFNTPGGTVYSYLNQYINLRYSNNASGTDGFSTVPTNFNYFGIYNSATPTPSANPAAYQWQQVAGGFGTTKTIYYSALGGRQVQWAAAASPPSSNFVESQANVAIDLDVVTTAAGTPGERGPIAMAYVVTTADPNTASSATLTGWFESSRDNLAPPIGTGLTPPVAGDTATFIYGAGAGTPSGTFSYNGSVWNIVVPQVISGNVLVANSTPGSAITNASISGSKIGVNTIANTNIQTDAITADRIAGNTITGNKIAGNTITGNLITVGTLTGNLIAANTITGNTIQVGTITANNIAANTITANNIAANTITATQISTAYLYTGNIESQTANIGNVSSYFDTVFAKATSAQYADLAEMYQADADYAPGTVLDFGGSHEVTMSQRDSSRKVAGVVSTQPAHVMNSTVTGQHVIPLALAGRVPVSVTGTVEKGDMLVSAGNGCARAESDPVLGTVIGKAIQNFQGGGVGVIEVVVGQY